MTANALKPKILVVDDDQGARASLSRLVAKAGCKAHAVASSGEAIQALSEIPFDAVITDLQLSDAGGGISVLRHVHQLKVDLPVLIVTGAPSFDTAQAAVEWGAFFYACKPYDPVALIERIRMAVSRSRDKFKRNVDLLERLHRELTDAIGSLHMAYQPIVMSDKGVYGYEALMRTRSDTLPNPMVLLDRAVELVRIPEIGRKVRRLVAADMEQGSGTMFVNLHPSELQDDDLFDPQAPLSRFSERVVLELTERASLEEIPAFQERVDRLRRMGFRVAIDDVGAGYSSLNSIAMLAPDVVKIDMALCAGVSTDPVKQRLLRSMVSAFRELGSLVVAEGVETPDDFAELQGVRCDLFQGYLFAKPGPAYPMVA